MEGSTTVESVQSLTPEWGSHFWVVIEDPKVSRRCSGCTHRRSTADRLRFSFHAQTHHLLFYNPSMGECRWTVPKGTFVLPRDPERDWLEFLDETTSLPYYWHAHSRTAQWERPSAARLIIPLMALQKLTASNVPLSPSNLSQLRSRSSTGTLPSLHQRRNRPALSVAPQLTRTRSNVDISETHSHHINQASNPASDASITTPGRRRSSTATGSVLLKRKVDASSNGTRTANPSVYPGSTEPTRHPTESHIPTEDSGVVLLSETASWKGKGDIPTSDSRLTFSSSLRKISEHADGSSLTLQEDAKLNAMSKATRKDKRMIGLKVAPVAALLGIPRPPTGSAMSKANKGPRASSDRPPSFDTMTASSSAHEKMAMPYRRPRDPEKRFKAANIPAHSVSVRPHDSNSSISVHTSDKSQREKETSPSQHMDPFELYATENYHRRRKGLFKRKIDPPEPLRWQHNHLASPLLSLPRDLHRDAILSSKIVLRICGEREKPVFFGKPPLISVGFTPHDHSSSNRGGDLLPMSVKALRCGNTRIRSDKTQSSASSGTQGAASTWQEQRWVIETCICKSLLRDEVFCQVISRLSKAAPPTSRFRAWQFLGVLLASLCPTSSELCASLCTFIDETCSDTKEHGSLLTLARHCQSRLFAIMQRGPSVVAPSVEEIQGSWEAAFNPSIFGQTLEQVMKAQSLSFPDLQVPVILPFLGEALSKLNPPPGMFRSGGNVHKQIDLRLRIDRGQYTLKGIVEDQRDVLVVGSVLKTFLRELAEPLIPQSAYEACIDAAARESIPGCTALLASKSPIPALNRRSLLYLIALLQRFSRPEIVKVTGVDAVSLASIFSPTIFRGPSTDVAVISHNARFESKWLHAQILHLPCDNVDPDYVPTIPQSSRSFPSSLHLQRSDSKQHSYRGVAYSVAHRYEDLRRPPRPNMTPQTRSSGR